MADLRTVIRRTGLINGWYESAGIDLGVPNTFRLSRRSHAVLVPDSADDHKTLYAYSLPRIVIYARNALLSAISKTVREPRMRGGGPRVTGVAVRAGVVPQGR